MVPTGAKAHLRGFVNGSKLLLLPSGTETWQLQPPQLGCTDKSWRFLTLCMKHANVSTAQYLSCGVLNALHGKLHKRCLIWHQELQN